MDKGLMLEVYRTILTALDSRLHLIGSVLDGDARRLTLERGIYDKGDFHGNMGYVVTVEDDGVTLHVGSNVRHEPFVLGGKVPSWTPLAPLKAWVERKHLAWTDRETGKELTVTQMAFMIRGKIKREGITARNIYEEILNRSRCFAVPVSLFAQAKKLTRAIAQ